MKTVVLLAACRGEKFLPELLDSLVSQTDPDFTVLFQNDGGQDETERILRAWESRDARFHSGAASGRHLGAAGNFLSLLSQAEGDLFLFCDQDDLWEKEKVAELKKAMSSAASSVSPEMPLLVHSDASVIDEEGRLLCPSFFRLQGWDPGAVTLNRLLVQNNATGCTMIFNRPLAELLRAHADPSRLFMHDWFAALTAAAFGEIVFLDRALTRYRQHDGNAIGASRTSLFRRGFRALHSQKEARERIALTYSNARAFLESYGEDMPPEARKTIDSYLRTESLPKLARIQAVRGMGCVMQSPVTRLGQIFFG